MRVAFLLGRSRWGVLWRLHPTLHCPFSILSCNANMDHGHDEHGGHTFVREETAMVRGPLLPQPFTEKLLLDCYYHRRLTEADACSRARLQVLPETDESFPSASSLLKYCKETY